MKADLEQLLELMRCLRNPEHGCPWDLAQDFTSIVPHTLEEAYEVAHAIESGDFDALPGELGDLLFQVVFYAQLGNETGRFDFHGAHQILTDQHDDWERLAQGLLEYETLTGEEIKRVMRGEPPQSGDDADGSSDQGNAPSVTAIPKTKPKKAPPEGGMEPEPSV